MGEVIGINQKRFFTLDEAAEILPVVRRVTGAAYQRVKNLSTRLSLVKSPEDKRAVQDEIQAVFQEWHAKVTKLGGEAKGMWLVDFDTGEGYYCWLYPESEIAYYHGYQEGFRGRVKIP